MSGFKTVQNAPVINPKMMAGRFTNLAQDFTNGTNITRAVWVFRVACNTDKAVFGERTGGLCFLSFFGEPLMGKFMMNVHGVRQSKQQIGVKTTHEPNAPNC